MSLPPSPEQRLRAIADAHQKNVDGHGGTDGFCVECDWTWPCPTYVWAVEQVDPDGPFDQRHRDERLDDDPEDTE